MKKWSLKGITYLLLLSLIFPIIAGCDIDKKVADNVKEHYPLESVGGKGNQTSYVYRAVAQPVTDVAAALSQEKKPEQQSKANEDRMFLVYPDEIIHIQKDNKNPKDSLIEINSKEYVQKNYSPGFLEGYLLSNLINNLFAQGGYGGNYQGYATKDAYKPNGTYHKPTLEERKNHPPLTVDRVGSIKKRSRNAETRSTLKDDPDNTTKSGYGNSSWRGNYEKEKWPNRSSRSGKIIRRRR